MGTETEPTEFENLQRRGKLLGLRVDRHKSFDPITDNGGDLYLQQRKAIFQYETGSTGNPPSLLKFATAEQVAAYLSEREAKRE